MQNGGARGLRRIANAAVYSIHGLRTAYRGEAAFRQELFGCLVLVPLALWLGATPLHRAALIGSLLLVLVTELINTAVEAAVDRIGPDYHVDSKRAKDIGSAAVFLSIVNAVVVWSLILW